MAADDPPTAARGPDGERTDGGGPEKPTTFFWGGMVLTMFVSVLSLVALVLHPDLRACKRRRGRYLLGVAATCLIHGIIAAIIWIILWLRMNKYI